MHRIDKFLAKLDTERRQKVLDAVERIKARNFTGLNMKKLGGFVDEYRVRVGRVRIMFMMNDAEVRIYDIDNKSDHTY
jgi:mRNA-degrading endonuclease RelE of RelBE toxin-antitoxin system